MTTTTLAALRNRARQRADQVNSLFLSDAEYNTYINEARQKLHAMVVDALGESYFLSFSTFTTATNPILLNGDFYKLYGVEMTIGARVYNLQKMRQSERNLYRNTSLYSGLPPLYWLTNASLYLYPTPPVGMSVTVLYAPEAAALSVDADSVNYPNGWEKFIVIDTAIQALLKEESSVTGLVAERDRIVKEIELTKENRDLAEPKRVREVDFERSDNIYLDRY